MPIRPLCKELQRVAKRELNELPNYVESDLAQIREWILQQPHLRARTDDQWLFAFLRAAKFNLQRTKDQIDYFYTVRNLDPEFWNRDPFLPEIQKVLNEGVTIVLPKTSDVAAPRVILNRWGNSNRDEKSLIASFKVAQMIGDILMMEDDNFVVAGASLIWDLNNLSYDYLTRLRPDYCKKLILLNQDIYPMRIKKVVIVNAPSPLVTIYDLFKIFSTDYIKNKLFFLEDDLLKHINKLPVSILPKDYGGDEASCNEIAGYWKAKVESYRDWFLEDVKFGVDETKRPEKARNFLTKTEN